MIATIIILAILLILSVLVGIVTLELIPIILVTMEEKQREYFDKFKNLCKKTRPKIYEIIDDAMEDDFPKERFDKILKKYE